MSSPATRLSPPAIKLLLDCLEAPSAVISGAVLQRNPAAARLLQQAQLIKPAGHEPVATALADDTDVPVSLAWSPEEGGYGYFSASSGWIRVPKEELVVWTVDMAALISILVRKLQPAPKAPATIVDGLLWNAGFCRLGRRPKRTSLMFGRRLADQSAWRAIREAIHNRRSPERQILLTSTKPDLLPEAPSNLSIVSLCDLILPGGTLELDGAGLALRLDHAPSVSSKSPVELFAEGREVHFYGTTFRFTKGFRQREVVNLLFQRYRQDELWVSSAEIVGTLDWNPKTRIRDIFKKSPAWNQLLTERHGMCGFCLPDLKTEK